MTDHDERLSRRYRELPADEPPAALDAAIVAHARRAVAPRRARWAAPVSIAAVLVLAAGITLLMQQEEPGIERPSAGTHVPAPAMPAPVEPPPEIEAPAMRAPEAAPTPKPVPSRASPTNKRAPVAPAARTQESFPQDAKPPRAEASDLAAPAATMNATPPAAAAAPAARAITSPASVAVPQQKRSADAKSLEAPDAQRDAELERIAALREAGRDAEADAALAAFHQRYPGYAIPDAMRARVKPK